MNGTGTTYRVLLVLVALATLFGCAAIYENHRDDRLEWAMERVEKRLDRMELKIDGILERSR